MATSTQTDAEFWRGVLTAGTFTAIPRWSGDRVPGTAEYRTAVPDDLLASLRRWTDEAGLPLSSVLLAAHAKVLAALSGEQAVATLRPHAGRHAAAVPAVDRVRLLACADRGHRPGAGGTAGAPGLPRRRVQARAGSG